MQFRVRGNLPKGYYVQWGDKWLENVNTTDKADRIAEFSGIPSTQATTTFQNVSETSQNTQNLKIPSTETLGS